MGFWWRESKNSMNIPKKKTTRTISLHHLFHFPYSSMQLWWQLGPGHPGHAQLSASNPLPGSGFWVPSDAVTGCQIAIPLGSKWLYPWKSAGIVGDWLKKPPLEQNISQIKWDHVLQVKVKIKNIFKVNTLALFYHKNPATCIYRNVTQAGLRDLGLNFGMTCDSSLGSLELRQAQMGIRGDCFHWNFIHISVGLSSTKLWISTWVKEWSNENSNQQHKTNQQKPMKPRQQPTFRFPLHPPPHQKQQHQTFQKLFPNHHSPHFFYSLKPMFLWFQRRFPLRSLAFFCTEPEAVSSTRSAASSMLRMAVSKSDSSKTYWGGKRKGRRPWWGWLKGLPCLGCELATLPLGELCQSLF